MLTKTSLTGEFAASVINDFAPGALVDSSTRRA